MKYAEFLAAICGKPPGVIKTPHGAMHIHTNLLVRHLDKDDNELGRQEIKDKVITTAFVNKLVDMMQSDAAAEMDDFKWHWSGTGTQAEAVGDTGLLAGLTSTGTRPLTGTQTEGTSSNIYKSVCTVTYDGTYNIREHGFFGSSSTGVLADRTMFAVIAVADTNKIEFTFTMEYSSGG